MNEAVDWNAAKFFLDFVALAAAAIACLISLYVARRKADGSELRQLKERLIRQEIMVAAMPTMDSLHRLGISMESLCGEIKAVNATVRGLGTEIGGMKMMINRQEEHLLDMTKGK